MRPRHMELEACRCAGPEAVLGSSRSPRGAGPRVRRARRHPRRGVLRRARQHADGHDFASQAVESGAVALVVERAVDPRCRSSSCRRPAPRWRPPRTRSSASRPRARGRRGDRHERKTTTAYLLDSVLRGRRSTAGPAGHDREPSAGRAAVVRTTPESVDLQRTFREMLDAGNRSCALEASSHDRAPPARRRAVRRARLHEPWPRPPRLPRDDRGLLRREAPAVPAPRRPRPR